MTAISLTIKKYFATRGDTKTKEVLFVAPFNFREPPLNPKEFEFSNQFSIFPLYLPMVADFKTGVKQVARVFNKIKSSNVIFGMNQLLG